MKNNLIERNILCIDLKSFFASCECVQKHLDPFSYPLVVANPTQGNGAITLAVTPYLKTLGVKSRGRLYEIPKNIKYFIAKPQMGLYAKISKEVVSIYLNFVSKEDLHIYSIDECFLDVTTYLKMYHKTDYELAKDILNEVYKKTGLTATCGIGPNMLLAKVSMDIEAKHTKDNIAKWTYEDVEKKLWKIDNLSDMWGIGKRMEKNLHILGIKNMKDLANTNKGILKDHFGVLGEELWNHANGIDNSLISDFNKQTYDKSYSHSQVLFKDYNDQNIRIIISEMIEVITARLRKNHKQATGIGFGIGYSKNVGGGFYHTIKLDSPTDSSKEINKMCNIIFDKYYEDMPIRKVSIAATGIIAKVGIQLNLFESLENIKEEEKINDAVDKIKDKFGKNSVLKASNLLNDSTAIERNKKIGGHSE